MLYILSLPRCCHTSLNGLFIDDVYHGTTSVCKQFLHQKQLQEKLAKFEVCKELVLPYSQANIAKPFVYIWVTN